MRQVYRIANAILAAAIALLARTAPAASVGVGVLDDEAYAHSAAETNLAAIGRMLSRDRLSGQGLTEEAFLGISHDLKIVNEHREHSEVHLYALEALLQDSCLAKCPTGGLRIAAKYFSVKKDVLLSCFNYPEIYADEANADLLAKFWEEIVARRIPDYRFQGTSRPGWGILTGAGVWSRAQLTNEAQKAAYDAAVRENDNKLRMNELQQVLDRAVRILGFQMKHQKCRVNFMSDSVQK